VPEDTREVRIERAEVEQRLVDIEDQYTVALRSHLRRGRDSNPRAFRLPAFQAGALGHYATSPAVNYGSDDVRRRQSISGEGGIRTREAFAYRFSRAAPSTTRTPLRA